MFSRAPACRSPSNRVDHRYLVQVRPLGQRLGPATSQPRAAHARCKAFKEPREQLSAEEVEEWDRCAARLVDLGIEPEQAESILKESYGWCATACRFAFIFSFYEQDGRTTARNAVNLQQLRQRIWCSALLCPRLYNRHTVMPPSSFFRPQLYTVSMLFQCLRVLLPLNTVWSVVQGEPEVLEAANGAYTLHVNPAVNPCCRVLSNRISGCERIRS